MMKKSNRFIFSLCFIFLLGAKAGNTWADNKYLIEWCWGNHDTPIYIAGHLSFIESMPFDGMVINNYAGRNFFTSNIKGKHGVTLWNQKTIAGDFLPLRNKKFKKFTQNFAKMHISMQFNPPPLSDDAGWQLIVASAENYAAVIKQYGFKGIFFDNEVYSGTPYWEVQRWTLSTRATHAELARKRGQQLMSAFMAAYPEIVVIAAHSPSESCEKSPADIVGYRNSNYMAGYFFSGMALAVRSPALLVDGGEEYGLRSDSDFARSYQWRKYGIATSNCNVVPDSLRPLGWAERVSIGYGIYDTPVGTDTRVPMNPAIARTTIANALRHADNYVWHYSEKLDWWGQAKDKGDIPLVTEEWKQAVKSARETR